MKKYLLIAFLFASLIISSSAFAGDIVTITKTDNVNGSIVITLRNEYFPKMFTDASFKNATILLFYLDGNRIPVDPSRSVESLGPGFEGKVTLKAGWPSSGFQNLTILYADSSGTILPPQEWTLIFAKPAFSVKDVTTDPLRVYTNNSVKVLIRITASGDKDISNINTELMSQPRYFQLTDVNTPTSLKAGETKTFYFTFKQSGESLPETVLYSTAYLPLKITYNYYGYETKAQINESFVVLNRFAISNSLPQLNLKLDLPASIKQNENTSLNVYAWNSIIGSNKICDVNLTLISDSSGLELPITNVLSSDLSLAGRADTPDEPIATFPVKATADTPAKTYTLTANATYTDCDWKIPGVFKKSTSLEVNKSLSATAPTPVLQNNTTNVSAVPKVEQKKTGIKKAEPQKPVKPKEPKKKPVEGEKQEASTLSIFLIILAIVGIVVLFGAIYFFEVKSQSIY